MTARHRALLAGASAALAAMAVLAPAQASALTARVAGDRVEINAVGTEKNTIRIDFLSTKVIEIRELAPDGPALFGLGLACDRVGTPAEKPRRLVCNGDSLVRVTGDLGPGDDVLTVTGLARPVDISGGGGTDDLSGGASSDRLDSGPDCSARSEHLSGGPGNDRLLAGGFLGACPSAVIASGGPGDDVIQGGAVGDALAGEDGADTISGGSGQDRLDGGDGDDTLLGEGGDDDLLGGIGADRITGGPGDDLVTADDGEEDRILCDAEGSRLTDGNRDTAVTDLQDVLVRFFDCELVFDAPLGLHPTVRILAGTVRVGAGIRVDLSCPAVLVAPCAGSLRATAVRGRRGRLLTGLGRTEYTVPAGGRRTVRVRLDTRARKVLDASPRVRLTSVEPGNEIGPKTATVTLATPG